MKKRNIFLIGIIILVIIIFLVIGYKSYILYTYDISKNTVGNYLEKANNYILHDDISLQYGQDVEDFLEINNIKIRNDFKEFTLNEEQSNDNSVKYILYDELGKVDASFWISTTDTYINIFKNDQILKSETLKILDKYDIINDEELFNFLSSYKPISRNLLTNTSKIKEDYYINYMMLVMLPEIDKSTRIVGYDGGYIFDLNDDFKEISIIKNDKRYVFTFTNSEYFTDEYVEELVNTIVIN